MTGVWQAQLQEHRVEFIRTARYSHECSSIPVQLQAERRPSAAVSCSHAAAAAAVGSRWGRDLLRGALRRSGLCWRSRGGLLGMQSRRKETDGTAAATGASAGLRRAVHNGTK
jgi:hypothetical protein